MLIAGERKCSWKFTRASGPSQKTQGCTERSQDSHTLSSFPEVLALSGAGPYLCTSVSPSSCGMIGHMSSHILNPFFFSIRNSLTICASYKKFKYYRFLNNLKNKTKQNLFRDLKDFSQGSAGTKSSGMRTDNRHQLDCMKGVEEAAFLSMGDNLAQRNGVLRAG